VIRFKKYHLGFFTYGLIILLNFIFSPSVLAAGEEFKLSVKQATNKVWLRGEVDYRQEGGHLFRRHYDVGLRGRLTSLGDGWSLGLHYRLVYKQVANRGWGLEKRPYIQIQKAFDTPESAWLPELKWSLRTRHEFRFRQYKEDSQRNRVKLKVKMKQGTYSIRPFISNEYYYDFNKNDLTKVRFDLGVELPRIMGGKPSLYYKHTSTYKKNKWQPYSGLVLKLDF